MDGILNRGLPHITLTNPLNKEQTPSPAQSPIRDGESYNHPNVYAGYEGAHIARPSTAEGSWSRPDSSNGSSWTSPIRLKRSLSSNAGKNGPEPSPAQNGDTSQDAQASMDPLSQHLMQRTNTIMSPPSRPRTPDSSPSRDTRRSKSPSPAPSGPVRTDTNRTEDSNIVQKDLKKGVKAVSFLTKLMGGKKKDSPAASIVAEEAASISGEDTTRPEGTDAPAFAQPVDNIGFNPRHPQPPAYIKVRSKNKQKRDFDRLFLAQELLPSTKRRKIERLPSKLKKKSEMQPDAEHTIWAMQFSKDGKYLAAAGADKTVRVWAVLASSEDRQKHEKLEAASQSALSAPVFMAQPVREFEAHTATILDLSWSKNNFLLSSSMDKTVRLWHMSRSECLCTFKHADFVPSIAFHPKDDRFFLAGSLDSKLRLWSIPDKSVAFVATVPDMVTAVAFTPDGKYAIAGCFGGLVMFFETEGLRYQSQMHVKSSRGRAGSGSKITGIQAVHSGNDNIKLLVTSNDSRIRLYNFRDKSLEVKLKGNENNCSQIRASLSECGKYVTCGSEDKRAYIWSLRGGNGEGGEKREKHPIEFFEAHDSITTIVCVAPGKTRGHLSRSEDPVYDLCNPPPVTLMSRAERAESVNSSRPPSVQLDPEKAQPSPAFLSRAAHSEGNIIVTADFTGRIKVFRQDCAWAKRKVEPEWDRSSIFGGKKGTTRSGRSGSTSMSLATKGSQRSLRGDGGGGGGRTSTSTQPSGERIVRWRQGVDGADAVAKAGVDGDVGRSGSPGSKGVAESLRSALGGGENGSRSGSPTGKAERARSLRSVFGGGGGKGGSRSGSPTSKAGGGGEKTAASSIAESVTPRDRRSSSDASSLKPKPQQHCENPMFIKDGQSYTFWDVANVAEHAQRLKRNHDLNGYTSLTPVRSMEEGEGGQVAGGAPLPFERGGHLAVRPPVRGGGESYVSQLSDERSSGSEEEEGSFEDAKEQRTGSR